MTSLGATSAASLATLGGPGPLLVAALAAAGSVALWARPRAGWRPIAARPPAVPREDLGWLHRWRSVWAALSGLGGATFVSGRWGVVAGVLAGAGVWAWIGRCEPVTTRRRREAAARDLPGLVHLLATALESGCDVGVAVRLVCEALPGDAAGILSGVPGRLALGVSPEAAWNAVLDHVELAPLARTMMRAQRSGSSVTTELARLALELEGRAQARLEEQARSVGVKAAVPLGLCLLPAFLILGVVPLVAALLGSLRL